METAQSKLKRTKSVAKELFWLETQQVRTRERK